MHSYPRRQRKRRTTLVSYLHPVNHGYTVVVQPGIRKSKKKRKR